MPILMQLPKWHHFEECDFCNSVTKIEMQNFSNSNLCKLVFNIPLIWTLFQSSSAAFGILCGGVDETQKHQHGLHNFYLSEGFPICLQYTDSELHMLETWEWYWNNTGWGRVVLETPVLGRRFNQKPPAAPPTQESLWFHEKN